MYWVGNRNLDKQEIVRGTDLILAFQLQRNGSHGSCTPSIIILQGRLLCDAAEGCDERQPQRPDSAIYEPTNRAPHCGNTGKFSCGPCVWGIGRKTGRANVKEAWRASPACRTPHPPVGRGAQRKGTTVSQPACTSVHGSIDQSRGRNQMHRLHGNTHTPAAVLPHSV